MLQWWRQHKGPSKKIWYNIYFIHIHIDRFTTPHLYGTTQPLHIFLIDRHRTDLPQSNRSFLKSKVLKLKSHPLTNKSSIWKAHRDCDEN
jgi:hypothetical protein